MRNLAFVIVLGACGRVGFDPAASDGSVDGAGDDGAGSDGPCVLGPWSTPMRVPNLSLDGIEDWEPTLSPDGLALVFVTYRVNNHFELDIATRASTSDPFGPPVVIPGIGRDANFDVIGPEWSRDGTELHFLNNQPLVAAYLGNGTFGAASPSGLPGVDPALTSDRLEVFTTDLSLPFDASLRWYTRTSTSSQWVESFLPASYNRSGNFMGDGWPAFDDARQDLYFEHEDMGPVIVRAHRDASGAPFPATFEVVTELGASGDPTISVDGKTMFLASDRRANTDNDIYMSTRSCQ